MAALSRLFYFRDSRFLISEKWQIYCIFADDLKRIKIGILEEV